MPKFICSDTFPYHLNHNNAVENDSTVKSTIPLPLKGIDKFAAPNIMYLNLA